MKKRGFTLIELLAVIVIMGIILAIAIPSIANIIEKSAENAWKNQQKYILDAAEKYVTSDRKKMPKKAESVDITLGELIDSGFIDEVIDPRTDEVVPRTTKVVRITNHGDGKITYEFIGEGTPVQSGKLLVHHFSHLGEFREVVFTTIDLDEFEGLPEYQEEINGYGGTLSFGEDSITITFKNRFDYGFFAFRSTEAFDLGYQGGYKHYGLIYELTDYGHITGEKYDASFEISSDKLYYVNLVVSLEPGYPNQNESLMCVFLYFTEKDTGNMVTFMPLLVNKVMDLSGSITLKLQALYIGDIPK